MTFKTAVIAALFASSAQVYGQDAAAIEHGKTVFQRYCTPCHAAGRGDDGAPMLPGTHALFLKYRGQKSGLLEERSDLPLELIKAVVRNGVASMPPFRKTEVTDEDLAAIAKYLAASAAGRAQ